MGIDSTITIGNLLQTTCLLIFALVFYFKRDSKVAELLANHHVRIKTNEKDIEQTEEDVRDLYKIKADKH